MEQTTKTNENVNEILDSVSDKIIAKRKQKKIIISSVILSIIVVLSAIVISLANIGANVHPVFLQNADAYRVYISNTETRYIDEDSKNYQEFLDKYNSEFQTTILTGMFTGKLSGCKIEESKTSFYTPSETDISSSLKSMLGGNYIRLVFNNEERLLTNGDGSTYATTEYPRGTILKFKDCYLKLDNTQTDTMTFYIGTYPEGWGTTATITTVTVRASSYSLYEYFSN